MFGYGKKMNETIKLATEQFKLTKKTAQDIIGLANDLTPVNVEKILEGKGKTVCITKHDVAQINHASGLVSKQLEVIKDLMTSRKKAAIHGKTIFR